MLSLYLIFFLSFYNKPFIIFLTGGKYMKTVNPLPFVDYVDAVCSDLKERGRVRSSEHRRSICAFSVQCVARP